LADTDRWLCQPTIQVDRRNRRQSSPTPDRPTRIASSPSDHPLVRVRPTRGRGTIAINERSSEPPDPTDLPDGNLRRPARCVARYRLPSGSAWVSAAARELSRAGASERRGYYDAAQPRAQE
jgi:hypothetical protein